MLHDLIFKDFWLKLFSLVLALLIWLTVSFAIQKEIHLQKQSEQAPIETKQP